MAEPYLAEIRLFGGNFAPRNYALCDGQPMAISGNEALFSLVGTIWGGDGRTTFALPEMRSRLPVGQGQSPGTSLYRMGERVGTETASLDANQIPVHDHVAMASSAQATEVSPSPAMVIAKTGGTIYDKDNETTETPTQSIQPAGGGLPHSNMMPSLCVNFIIALYGAYPSRS